MNELAKELLHQMVAFLENTLGQKFPNSAPFLKPFIDAAEVVADREIDQFIPALKLIFSKHGIPIPE